jgi:hypothetical protein
MQPANATCFFGTICGADGPITSLTPHVKRQTRYVLTRPLFKPNGPIAIAALVSSQACHAAAPVYFDLGGLIFNSVLYGVGLLALLCGLAVLRSSTARTSIEVVLLVYVVGPLVYWSHHKSEVDFRNSEAAKSYYNAIQENEQAFAAYCAGSQRVVRNRVAAASPVSVSVKFNNAFTGNALDFKAGQIAIALQMKKPCESAGVGFIEGAYDGEYIKDKGYLAEYRRYAACVATESSLVPKLASRYELRFGDVISKKEWTGRGGQSMSKSSVMLVDGKTGEVLAQDMLHFLGLRTEVAGCQNGSAQVAGLLRSVFSQQP